MSLLELRIKQTSQPITGIWQYLSVAPRGSTLLGISYRPLQALAFGLDTRSTLLTLLAYPYQLIRLGAYWNQIEPEAGKFNFDELDWQIEAAEQAGKQIILCVGPLKTFGYPEFFVPPHHLPHPFPENKLIKPSEYPSLLSAAANFIICLVERYQPHKSIVAWQLEHDAVDPLGMEHTWRLDSAFVEKEAQVLRETDPTRPVMMNGYLPTSLPVRLSQWWRTRGQGDSLAVAQRLADLVGIDYYPRNAITTVGKQTLYLDGSRSSTQKPRQKELLAWAALNAKKLLISEGQAEPWETITTPPNPPNRAMHSCLPEAVIGNYNDCITWYGQPDLLYAYLFWGAEYWILRNKSGDSSYLQAFMRVLGNAG